MRAAITPRYGPPEVIRIEEVPPPELQPDDLLIQVHASSVNPVDCKIRSGGSRGAIRYTLPWIQGMDLSGVVLAVGDRATGFSVGDEVYASPGHKRPGCYAEQVAVPAREVALKPKNLSHTQAATLPLVGLTAWQSLMPELEQGPGKKVFIQAGAGGVGTFAIQLARHFQAQVSTTCSPRNAQLVRDLGADRAIDYRSERFQDILQDQDIVLDSLGDEQRDLAFTVLRRGGRLSSIVSGLPGYTKRFGPNLGLAASILSMVRFKLQGFASGKHADIVIRKADGVQLSRITELVEQGAIRPVVDKVYPLEDIAQAHAHVETGRTQGKVAITLR